MSVNYFMKWSRYARLFYYSHNQASFTDDIVTKKMIFLYIVNYADESESAIMAINTFLKDLKNNNPKIRGLALRSLCSLK